MAQLIVRGLDDDIVRSLKIRAARRGRSAEAEHRAILESVLRPSEEDFARLAAELRARTRGRVHVDSGDLVREMRDER